MCYFVSRGERIKVESPEVIAQLIRDLEEKGRDDLLLKMSEGVFLGIILGKRYIAVQYYNYSKEDFPIELGASLACEDSYERVILSVGGTPTHIPRNRCLPRRTGVEVVRYFYQTQGKLYPQVFWLPEMPPSRRYREKRSKLGEEEEETGAVGLEKRKEREKRKKQKGDWRQLEFPLDDGE
jgi:hypothetical protein